MATLVCVRGNLNERRPGYWELKVSLGRDPMTGKPKYRTKGLRGTRLQAQRALAKLVAEVDAGRASPVHGTNVDSLLDQWLVHIEREGRSPTTMRGYRSLKRQLPPGFLKMPLKRVTPKILDQLYRHLEEEDGRGPSSVKHVHAMLRTAFNQGMRWELLDRNPALLATAPRVLAREVEPPEIADVRAVLKAAAASANPENALIFTILTATGCRRSELCGLRWTDLDLRRSKVTLRRSVVQVDAELHEKDTKAHQQRTVTLNRKTVDALRKHRADQERIAAEFDVELAADAFVFSASEDGTRPIPPDRLTQAWRRLADAVGVNSRLHDLRHFQASFLLDAGESITTVASRLGHRDTATTLRVYSHLMPGADERAADLVDGLFIDD